ncbi:phage protein [Stappia sp. 22II-S9-Z10]|nr:phage protein [Stappia sp. 22II-S9-Z10]
MAGSAVIGALRVNLGIDTAAFTKGLSSAQKELAAVGKRMQTIGTRMSVGITAPVVAFGASIAKTAGDFEAAMNRVGAVTGAPADGLARLTAQAKELGRTTQFSASQAADAMGFLGMAGFNVEQIIGAMPGTLQLAAAAQMDLASAADIVSNVLSGYGMKVEDLSRVNDVLVKTFTRTNTDLRQIGEAMKYAGPVAAAAGVSFEEAAAAIGLMGNAGIQSSMAGTSLRGAISRVLAPTKAMSKAMDAAGLKFTDANGKIVKLDEILRQLEPHAEDAGLFMELFGQRAGPAMAALVSQGSTALTELTKELEASGGTAERIATAQMQGFNGAMKELSSAFEGLKLAIADSGLLEFLTNSVKSLTQFVQRLGETNPALLKWGTILAGVAAMAGPVVLAVGAVALALSAISLPVAAGIAGVAALGGAFFAFGDQITGALGRAWTAISNTLGPPLAELATAAKAALDGLGEILRAIFGDEFINSLGGAGGALQTFFGTLAEFAGTQILANLAAALQLVAGAVEGWSLIFQAIAALIRGDFSGALQHLGAAATNAKDTLIQAFTTMTEPVRAAVVQLAQVIIDAFKALPAQMLQIGKDIIQGLINGIGSMASAAVDKVRSVGSSIVGAVRGVFDSHSPSRVMHAIGQDVMAGLTNGMSAGSAGAVAVAEQTAARVNQAVAMAAAAQGQGLGATVSAEAKEATSGLNSLGNMGQQIASTIGNAFGSLIDGSKKVKDVVLDLLKQFGNMMLNNVFQAISGGASGTGGAAGIGSIFSSVLGALPGFAAGGSMSFGGGNNSMDNQLAAFRVSAGETVDIHRGDQGRPVPVVNVYNNFDPTEWDTHIAGVASPIARREADSARRDVPAISRAADREGRLRKTRTLQGRFA